MSKFKKGDLIRGTEQSNDKYKITNYSCVCEVLAVLTEFKEFQEKEIKELSILNGNHHGNMIVKPIISSTYGKKVLPKQLAVIRKYFQLATQEDIEELRKEFLVGDL